MRDKEHRKDVDKLIKEIKELNVDSKGLIVDLNDYNEIKKQLEEIQLTLKEEILKELEKLQLTLLRNV